MRDCCVARANLNLPRCIVKELLRCVEQDAGQDAFDAGSAFLVNRYIGSIMEATIAETSVSWIVNPGINKLNAQVPTRKVTVDMLDKWRNA